MNNNPNEWLPCRHKLIERYANCPYVKQKRDNTWYCSKYFDEELIGCGEHTLKTTIITKK